MCDFCYRNMHAYLSMLILAISIATAIRVIILLYYDYIRKKNLSQQLILYTHTHHLQQFH